MMIHAYQLVLIWQSSSQLETLNVSIVNTYQGRGYNTIGGKRSVGKPKRKWNEAVEEDSKKQLGLTTNKTEVLDRQA